MSKEIDQAVESGFAEQAHPSGETYSGSRRLARGNFGEKTATDALAADGYDIILSKPRIEGTNQGGIDIVALRGDRIAMVDNKALTRTGNVSSVSALTTNYQQNLAEVRAEIERCLAQSGISAGERDTLQRALDAIKNNRVDRIITNANVSRTAVFTSDVTDTLWDKGIRFLNVVP